MKRAHPLAKSTWINLRSTKVWATTPETETWALLIDLVTLDKWWSIWPTNWGMGTDMDPSALRLLMVIFNFFARSASFFRWSLVRVRYKEGSHDLGTHCSLNFCRWRSFNTTPLGSQHCSPAAARLWTGTTPGTHPTWPEEGMGITQGSI